MRNFLQAFLFFCIWFVLAFFIHKNVTHASTSSQNNLVNNNHDKTDNTTKLETKKPVLDSIASNETYTKVNLSKVDTALYIMPFTEKFVTSKNNKRVIFPRKFFYFKDSIFNYLNNNPTKEIVIEGQYTTNESLPDGENFGNKRAKYLKELLVRYGANSSRIKTTNKLSEYEYDPNGYYADGITIYQKNLSNINKEALEKDITNKTLYSYFGDNNFKPDRSLQTYTQEVKNYLKLHTNKHITIIGHTDNVGDEEANKWIGLERAKNVANYFISQGIEASKITTISKGETTPITNNNTKQERAKNRRIEIQIN
ncbi:OmpA family protein [Tenacibaculum geojense]|uniref:OmpA family protein n=1 Tax=Tenacibaculum geojense TaxID=915352 RepID=A0ABW3JNR8_9FLAO